MMTVLTRRPAKPPITPSAPPISVAMQTGTTPISNETRPP